MEKIKIKRFPLTVNEYEKVFSITEERSKKIDKKLCKVSGKKDYELLLRFERQNKRAYLFLVFHQEDKEQVLSVGKFGEGRFFDDSPLPMDNYDTFCSIFQEEVIPIIKERLYDLFGMKKEYFKIEFISRFDIEKAIEII